MAGLRAVVALVMLAAGVRAELGVAQIQRAAAPALPPISHTCPHHPDVIESRPGKCPLCGMVLVPQRLDAEWMCPVHSVVHQDQPGTCRLCRRPLVPVTMTLTWTCRGEADHLEPGQCRDGTPRLVTRTLRAHGNHNPQHGGQFFMAPDNWHHLEGTHPRDRTVRIYVYDDYARALGSRRLREVQGRLVTRETFNPATRQTTEHETFPLRPSRDGTYLEGRIGPAKLPLEVTAKLKLGKDAPEYRFDFTFRELTRDTGAVAPLAPTSAAGAATVGRPTTTDSATAGRPATPDDVPPPAASDRFARLRELRAEIDGLIKKGDFGGVWVPAFAAKDLAVELEAERADPALRDLVRTAWRLDAVGDAGNRQEVEQAFAAFSDALRRTLEAFGK